MHAHVTRLVSRRQSATRFSSRLVDDWHAQHAAALQTMPARLR